MKNANNEDLIDAEDKTFTFFKNSKYLAFNSGHPSQKDKSIKYKKEE